MLTFVTYVFGDYYRYIPYYIFGINHSYPEHRIRVFTDRPLTEKEKHVLYPMQSYELRVFNIRLDRNYIRGGNGRAFRWLIPWEEMKDLSYSYIGDVDMMIGREDPTLLESHKRHMRDTGLPFSNGIRREGRRMSGLHFIDVKPYYDKVGPVIESYLKDKEKLAEALKKCDRNEHFLYNMIKSVFSLNGMEAKITDGGELYYRPHHGLHLGLLRSGTPEKIELIPKYIDSLKRLLEVAPLPELKTYIE